MNKITRRNGSAKSRVRIAGVAKDLAAPLEAWRITKVDATLPTITVKGANAISQIEFPTGSYMYRQLPFALVSNAAIAGVTTENNGVHYIDTEHMADYVKKVTLRMSGSILQEFTMGELITLNDYHELEFANGIQGFCFPGFDIYEEHRDWDAFSLGTGGQRALYIELEHTAAWDNATMDIQSSPHFVQAWRDPAFLNTTEVNRVTFSSAGDHTFENLPDGKEMRAILIDGDGITKIKVEVDGVKLYEMDRHTHYSMLLHYKRDPSVLGDAWLLDFHLDRRPRSLAGLDLPQEIRRGAKVKLTITTTNESTPVKFVTVHSGLYKYIG